MIPRQNLPPPMFSQNVLDRYGSPYQYLSPQTVMNQSGTFTTEDRNRFLEIAKTILLSNGISFAQRFLNDYFKYEDIFDEFLESGPPVEPEGISTLYDYTEDISSILYNYTDDYYLDDYDGSRMDNDTNIILQSLTDAWNEFRSI